ncbi:hypothetical protein WH47_01791 [Habropoda laboriosa]|uniref:Uncharacterized protein n=1 Tax=Habropoda laboriosa TaxID=597456 RepID=A0A0L7QTW5_9HYME|nr:hypothetical protein WH47_01791 [Habropoda laboriosa]
MSGTPMKYPRTLSFYHFYFKAKRGWVVRYRTIIAIISLPLSYKITKPSYNPENVTR